MHANLPALEAVLRQIDSLKPDMIVCLGDLIDFAPWPHEVIEIIRSRGICTLMGNHDERIACDIQVTLSNTMDPRSRPRESARSNGQEASSPKPAKPIWLVCHDTFSFRLETGQRHASNLSTRALAVWMNTSIKTILKKMFKQCSNKPGQRSS